MPEEEDLARAIACFQQSDDVAFLRDVLQAIRPRAAAEVRRYVQRNREAPSPEEIAAAPQAASPREAMRTVRATRDFARLQALSRAAGARLEALQGSSDA